ncbi:MAG: hypothetical protein AAF517_08355 [Planctomycetota bacterium]
MKQFLLILLVCCLMLVVTASLGYIWHQETWLLDLRDRVGQLEGRIGDEFAGLRAGVAESRLASEKIALELRKLNGEAPETETAKPQDAKPEDPVAKVATRLQELEGSITQLTERLAKIESGTEVQEIKTSLAGIQTALGKSATDAKANADGIQVRFDALTKRVEEASAVAAGLGKNVEAIQRLDAEVTRRATDFEALRKELAEFRQELAFTADLKRRIDVLEKSGGGGTPVPAVARTEPGKPAESGRNEGDGSGGGNKGGGDGGVGPNPAVESTIDVVGSTHVVIAGGTEKSFALDQILEVIREERRIATLKIVRVRGELVGAKIESVEDGETLRKGDLVRSVGK